MQTSVWVLENSKQYYLKIHLAKCHACNNGQGPKLGHSGRWRGPFTSYTEALAWAKSTNKPVESCKFCNPQSLG